MEYKHLFFDLDRTLWDYDTNAAKALSIIYSEFKLDRHFTSSNEFFHLFIKHNEQLWQDYRDGGINKKDIRNKRFFLTLKEKEIENIALSHTIGDRFMEITPMLNNLFPNTIETLEYLYNKSYKLYILTNGFIATQHQKMVNSKIDAYFIQTFSSEALGTSKPKKDFFHWTVSSIHAKKSQCLMIGDDLHVDIHGAMNYGINAVWFNPKKEIAKSKPMPSFTISDLTELMSIL